MANNRKSAARPTRDELATRLRNVEKQLGELQTGTDILQRDLLSERARATSLERELAAVRAQAAEASELRVALIGAEGRSLEAEKAREAATAEAVDLKKRLVAAADADVEIRRLRTEIEAAAARLDVLLTENQRLAEQTDSAQSDRALFRDQALTADARQKVAVAEVERTVQARFESELARLRDRNQTLESTVGSLSAQLAGDGKLAVLSPGQIGELTGRLISNIESSLSGLRLSQGELKLKLGLAQSGGQTGFVVVGPNAPATLKDQLHDFSLKFDRASLSEAIAAVDPSKG